MKLRLNKESLFYIPWVVMVIHFCVANSSASEYGVEAVSYICAALLGIKVLGTGKYSTKQILFILSILFISILSVLRSKDMRFFWLALVLCASKGIDFNKTIKLSMITTLFCCSCFVILYFLGVLDGARLMSLRGIRMSFGLGHPNMCSAYYSLLAVYILFLYYDKIKIRHIILMILGAGIVYYYTKSNTGLVVLIFSVLIFFVLKYIPLKKLNSKLIFLTLVIVILAFTLMPILYTDKLEFLDIAMTGRLHQANYYFQKYGVSLLGKDVSADMTRWDVDNILDIGFTRMLLYNGLLYYLFVILAYFVGLIYALRKQNRRLLILIGTLIIYTATENVATYIFMNPAMLILAWPLFGVSNICSERRKIK